MGREKATSSSNPLSVVVALGKQLSRLDDPLDQLLAYCRAVKEIYRSLERVYVAFFQGEGLLPKRVFLFEAASRRLLFVDAGNLTSAERNLFREFSKRKRDRVRGKGSMLNAAEEQEFVDALFTAGAGVPRRKAGKDVAGGGTETARKRLLFADYLPLRSRGGREEGWVIFSAAREGLWDREDHNAVSVCTDIFSAGLDRANLFAKVLRAKKEWERSVDAIGDVVMIVARDYTVVRGNQRLAELSGAPVKALRGRKCHSLLASLRKPCPNCPVEATFRSVKGRTAEVHRSRGEAVYQVWSYPILDPSGRPDSMAVYEKNVTTYKRMQEKLVQAEKMVVLGELAAAVAHELNNPLSGVISFSKILLREMDPELPHVEDIQNIEHAALRCKKIVQDLLVFARKPVTVRHEPVCLAAILEQARGLLRQQLERKEIELNWTLPSDLPDLPFHPDLLHQILVNLITNAIDASKEGGSIEIQAGRRRRRGSCHLGISVRDMGGGIPREIRDKVFVPFFTTKGPGEGTGLGLSICRNLMDAFGGVIEVSSRPGKGTTFLLLFPLEEGPQSG